jgi:RNA polymerase primary sigma factor/RNA polymerase sigma factor
VAVNRERVERGERFRQLTDVERQEIIFRARRLAAAGGGPAEIYRRIAKHTNRSVETIRHTVKQFGQRYPGLAVFPGRNGKLDDEAKKKIFRLFRQGHGVEFLVKRFGRTRTTIYRVIQEVRSKRIMELPLDFMFNEDFTKPGAAKKILVETPPNLAAVRKSNTPVGLPQYLASLYDVALLTREQEIHIFRQFNYLKYRANKLREGLKSGRLRTSTMDRIEGFYEQAVRVKNRIVQANLRLVVSIAKRHVGTNEDFFGLVSDGNMSLIRAVEKFDYGRGFKFSTYSSWAIMKNFARSIPEEFKHRDRFRTSQDEMFLLQEDLREDEFAQENMNQVRKQQIRKMLAHLDDREKKIIIRRFGLNPGEEPLTLQEVGLELGVTKERIRQLEARALTKLRCVAKDERLELPD